MSATVRIRWSKEPEKRAWMLEHSGGRPIADVCRDFELEFGHEISRTQVSLFRAEYGLQRRRGNRTAHRKDAPPVGTERVTKGYVVVKVKELPDRPQSKDNWRFKHVVAWEKANGRSLPDGWMVLFADHDRRNFDPENLVAVPRSLIGIMNGGQPWHDRESLETAIGIARLKSGIASAVAGKPVCGVCGREFDPDIRTGCRNDYRQRTCRECLDKGLRAPKDYGRATCPRCGARFHRRSASQIFCSKRCCYESYRERGAVRGKR